MDNQHKHIKGYRDLTAEEIALMNEVKAHAEQTRDLVSRVERYLVAQDEARKPDGYVPHTTVTHPLRWLAEARTDLQKGFMSLVRSIAQPTTF